MNGKIKARRSPCARPPHVVSQLFPTAFQNATDVLLFDSYHSLHAAKWILITLLITHYKTNKIKAIKIYLHTPITSLSEC